MFDFTEDEFKEVVLTQNYNESITSIYEALGFQATLSLIKMFSGEVLYIPVYKSTFLPIRNKRIKEDYLKNNMTVTEIARKYDLTSRHTYTVLFHEK